MSDSVRPQRRQPTRLPCPWDSPGKNTGVGCHFLLQCMEVKSGSEVARSCPTPSDPMDCSLPGSSVRGICQARVLEWVANKQGNNIQPWSAPFPIWNQSVVPCPVLIVASWPAYRFLKRQVRWSGIHISFRIFQFIVIHRVKGFGIVNKAEIDLL